MTMTASKSVHLGRRVVVPNRSLHAISSSISGNSIKTSQRPQKQSQHNNFFVAAAMEEQLQIESQFSQPSAKDIQQLLSNIGAAHRASLHTIESMIQRNIADDGDKSSVTAHEMIDLIARIRSL